MRLSIHIARRNYGQGEDRRYRAQKRLQRKAAGDLKSHRAAQRRFMAAMCRSPIAVHVDKPKEQHYELPSEFFRQVLGQRMKYNSCYWPDGITTLDTAEDAMLALA